MDRSETAGGKKAKQKKGTGNGKQATKRKRAEGQKKAGGHLLSRDGPSIIGAAELDFRVRNGNGYCLRAMATGMYDLPYGRGSRAGLAAGDSRLRTSVRERKPLQTSGRSVRLPDAFRGGRQYGQASRPISIARLCASPRLHLRPIDLVFSQGPSDGSWP